MRRSEITEQVVKFPPQQQLGNPADEAGQAVIAQIRKAGLCLAISQSSGRSPSLMVIR
jgi:hypothetical protein